MPPKVPEEPRSTLLRERRPITTAGRSRRASTLQVRPPRPLGELRPDPLLLLRYFPVAKAHPRRQNTRTPASATAQSRRRHRSHRSDLPRAHLSAQVHYTFRVGHSGPKFGSI